MTVIATSIECRAPVEEATRQLPVDVDWLLGYTTNRVQGPC